MDKEVRRRLMREDEREERELRGYIAQSVTSDMMNSLSGTIGGESRGDEVKTPAERQQEAAATGVAWMGQPGPDMRPNGR